MAGYTRPLLRVRVTAAEGTVDLVAPADLPTSPALTRDDGQRVVTRDRLTGGLELTDRQPVATDYRIDDDEFTVTVANYPDASGWQPLLRWAGDEIPGRAAQADDGQVRLSFPLVRTQWGRDGLALRAGKYTLALQPPSGEEVALPPAAPLLDRLPVDEQLSRYSAIVELHAGPPAALALMFASRWPTTSGGPQPASTSRRGARRGRGPGQRLLPGAVWRGRQLQRPRRPPGAAGPRNRSDPVLVGARPQCARARRGAGLVEGTRAWHDAIARSRYHMVNVHQLSWFSKPAGQVIIQTMHGYPYKIMGHAWWDKGGFPGAQVANYDRRAREWDYFVLTGYLRDPAAPGRVPRTGRVEGRGPRDRVSAQRRLAVAEAEEIRRRTREQPGAGPDQVVVMYAPTFRDYLSADDMTAERVDFFDAAAAARQLGDRYVVLVRGHAFNARARSRSDGPGGKVVDVTHHPDVNDLILASDAAVLDYSSLRFDYALTGKPMIFLVPDLAQYDRSRGGVIDYEPTAPGPRVSTTREVVAQLRDLEALRRATRARVEEFRTGVRRPRRRPCRCPAGGRRVRPSPRRARCRLSGRPITRRWRAPPRTSPGVPRVSAGSNPVARIRLSPSTNTTRGWCSRASAVSIWP